MFRSSLVATACAATAVAVLSAAGPRATKDDKKPSISLRASPAMAFTPARVVVTAEIKGGPNDYEEFYCPAIEWIWGDGTKSESKIDCEPYEPGKSEIKRRYVIEHIYTVPDNFRVEFWLKQKDKRVAGGRTTVAVRPGLRDGGFDR
jgi:hypothetical protein